MVKSIVSMCLVAIIVVCGAMYENNFVARQFTEFNEVLQVLYDKVDEKIATEDDVLSVQKNWNDKKKYLHIFIPHNEIKEIDLWVSEAITLVHDKEWTDAKSKVQVLLDLSIQIPKTFKISIENIL